MDLITAELKDTILTSLFDKGMHSETIPEKDCSDYNIDKAVYWEILEQFQQMKLIRIEKPKFFPNWSVDITAYAHDLIRLGGFVGQEKLLIANIEKLHSELELLKKQLSAKKFHDRIDSITDISNAIISALSFFKPFV